jgi:hypothetical protein
MNSQSSRSHAIFSLTLTTRRRVGAPEPLSPTSPTRPNVPSLPHLSSNPSLQSIASSPNGSSIPSSPARSIPRPSSIIQARTMSPTPNGSRPTTPSALPTPGSKLRPASTLGAPIALGRALSPLHPRKVSEGGEEEEEDGGVFGGGGLGKGRKEKESGEWVVTTRKIHFVDLAGSERVRRLFFFIRLLLVGSGS